MLQSKTFTIIGIISFLLICAAIGLQILELDAYGEVDPIIEKVFK